MTKEELILNGKHKVRSSPDLMFIYISLFEQTFGYKPNCAGCTFSNDWDRFVRSNNKLTEVVTVSNKTFKLKRNSSDILWYKVDGDKRTFRSYANKFTENFAVQFLTHGSSEEIESRKKLFEILPLQFRTPPVKEKKTRKPRTKKI